MQNLLDQVATLSAKVETLTERAQLEDGIIKLMLQNQIKTECRILDQLDKQIKALREEQRLESTDLIDQMVRVIVGTLDYIVGDESVTPEVRKLLTNDVISLVGLENTYTLMDYVAGTPCQDGIRAINLDDKPVYVPTPDDLERLKATFKEMKERGI